MALRDIARTYRYENDPGGLERTVMRMRRDGLGDAQFLDEIFSAIEDARAIDRLREVNRLLGAASEAKEAGELEKERELLKKAIRIFEDSGDIPRL